MRSMSAAPKGSAMVLPLVDAISCSAWAVLRESVCSCSGKPASSPLASTIGCSVNDKLFSFKHSLAQI